MSGVATAKIDERGRLVVPKAVREALGIYEESAIVRLENQKILPKYCFKHIN